MLTYFLFAALIMGPANLAQGNPAMVEVVAGNTSFAFDLYGKLRAQPGNLLLSPYSLSTALAMTYAGARGETAAQMARVLHFKADPGPLDEAFRKLGEQLDEGAESRPFELAIANALWGGKDERFLPEFLELIARNYGAGLRQVDFHHPEQARRIINEWVLALTKDKIKDLLQPRQIGPDTALVLTNAIYFKGNWFYPFPKQSTRDEEFTLTSDEKIRVPTMQLTERLRYFDEPGLQGLELPYGGGALSMVVLLPQKPDSLAAVEESLSLKMLYGCLSKLTARMVTVSLPRFKFEAGFELKDALSALGMGAAFSSSADFSGMNGERDLFLSAVIHKAFIAVNEEGTEAAAASAVVVSRGRARPEPPLTFRADRPFLFLIRDNRSGSLLFLGRVTDPRG
jgi:serpin B